MRTGSTSAITATALAAVAALTLSACGGSSGDDGKIHASGKHTPKSKPSAKPSASADPGAPKITFPSDEKVVHVFQKTGDATKDALLETSSRADDATYQAISLQKTNTPALAYYNSGMAYSASVTYISGWTKDHQSWAGTVRFFDYKVTKMPDGTGSVIYCLDSSKAHVKDLKSGKVSHGKTSPRDYVLYNTRLAKSKQGRWQVNSVASKQGATQCQP